MKQENEKQFFKFKIDDDVMRLFFQGKISDIFEQERILNECLQFTIHYRNILHINTYQAEEVCQKAICVILEKEHTKKKGRYSQKKDVPFSSYFFNILKKCAYEDEDGNEPNVKYYYHKIRRLSEEKQIPLHVDNAYKFARLLNISIAKICMVLNTYKKIIYADNTDSKYEHEVK